MVENQNFQLFLEFLEFSEDGIVQAKYEQHFANGDLYKPIVKTIRCSPLIDLLPESVERIDYLSLDTEGSELKILRTIPFNDIDIRVISIDVSVSSMCNRTRCMGSTQFWV